MRKSLYAKFIFGYLVFILLSIAAITFFFNNNIVKLQAATQAKAMYDSTSTIASYYSKNFYEVEDAKSHDYAADIEALLMPDNMNVWIMSENGEILYSSRTDDLSATVESPVSFFSTSFYTITDFDGILSDKVLSVYSPIINTYKTYGYVVMNRDLSSVRESARPYFYYMYLILAGLLSLSFIFILIFHFNVYRPLKKLRKAAIEYTNGNFDYDIEKIKAKDEFGDMAEKMQYMAKEIKNTDDSQKKFIANVSHDFRSPLTSIKGYLTAMQDGTIPPEMYGKYLDILLFETERLNKLTENLLLLNTADSRNGRADFADFDLVPLTRNIAATFEVQCHAKKIVLDLVFGAASYMVFADQYKIQQVIYNLTDNAIKFSRNNSVINISIYGKNDKVFFSVKDSGVGIPKENLNKIWDRFYKTDVSRGKEKKGTGLGLSIVKEIINFHGENINVISTEGVGSEFIFTLQKSRKSSFPDVRQTSKDDRVPL